MTSRLLVADTPAEAVENIILHTDKVSILVWPVLNGLTQATDLLKRKKIKKELLFKYLHSKRVPIESVADKVPFKVTINDGSETLV